MTTFLIPDGLKVERKTNGNRKSIVLKSVTEPSLTIVVESWTHHGGHEEFDRLMAKGFRLVLHENVG